MKEKGDVVFRAIMLGRKIIIEEIEKVDNKSKLKSLSLKVVRV